MLTQGFKLRDIVQLMDGEMYEIMSIDSGFGSSYRFLGEDHDTGLRRYFTRDEIEKLIKSRKEVTSYMCPECEKELKVFHQQLFSFNQFGCCAECYEKRDEEERALWIDQDGYQIQLKVKQLLRKEG